MPTPSRDADGLPAIRRDQADRDLRQVSEQVRELLATARHRLTHGYPLTEAEDRVQQARAALDWLADRLAIAETGSLARVPRTGADDT